MTAEQLAAIADEPEERAPLPEGWRLIRLGDVADIVNGFGFTETLQGRKDLPFPFIKVSDMNAADSSVTVNRAANTVDESMLKTLRARTYPAGTIIFPKVGGALLTNKKRILGTQATFDNNIMGVVPKSVEKDWLYYWMLTIDLKTLANTQALPSLRQSDVSNLEIPLPPTVEEQRRIARVLDEQMKAVEEARRAVEEQLEAAKLLPRALFSEVFHGITPLTVDPLEQDAPDGWRWETLRNLARLESGHTPSRYHPEWWGGDIPWLALPDIRNLDGKTAFETSEYTNELGIANSSARILPTGTVCLSRTASVGFVTVMGKPMATSQDFVNWVCDEQLDPSFLSFILQASRDYLLSLATGAVHKTIYVPTVKEFRICLPDSPEQKRIAERLTEQMQAVENLKESLSAQLETVEKMPAALLRKAFAGEV